MHNNSLVALIVAVEGSLDLTIRDRINTFHLHVLFTVKSFCFKFIFLFFHINFWEYVQD